MILLRAEGFMPGCSMHDTMGGERTVTVLRGKSVHLPDGRRLGSVQDAVVDLGTWTCDHLFVKDVDPDLVEEGLNIAVPWRWVRGINDIIILRWFPETPVPSEVG